MFSRNHQPKIEVICGPMFSGKTDELLRRLRRLKYSKTDYLLFKPKVDNRYSEYSVVTHDSSSLQAFSVEEAQEILKICDENNQVKVIAIDESQFFFKDEGDKPNLVQVCQILKKHGYRVILTGLDMDFLGQPFGLIPELLAIADEITKLKSVCLICGADANMSFRLNEKSSQVQLGSTDIYQARCYEHWLEGIKEREDKE